MKRIKRISGILLIWALCFSFAAQSSAAGEPKNSPESVVEQYAEAIQNQDWEAYAGLHLPDKRDVWKEFFQDSNNIEGHIGILNITSAVLLETIEVRPEDVYALSSMSVLYESNDLADLKTYIVGMDCTVFENNFYFHEGANYFLLILRQENQAWYIDEMASLGDPQRYEGLGYAFSPHFLEYVENYEKLVSGDFAGKITADDIVLYIRLVRCVYNAVLKAGLGQFPF